MQILETPIEPAEPQVPPSPRRLGRFQVPARDFANWERLLPLMSRMVVVASVSHLESDYIEYTAFCEKFEITDRETVPPLYEYHMEMRESGAHLFMRK